MSIIIHIGYPKTASTWFQDEYFPEIENYDYLVDRWLFYKLIFESDSLLYNPEFTRDQVKKNIGKKNFILSSEQLTTSLAFGWHSGNYSIACAKKLKETYPGATIVIFIRRQQSLISSAYQQYLKNGGTFGLKKYLYSGEVFDFNHLLFDKLISYYDQLFGSDRVKVYLYEDFKEDNHTFLEKFNADLDLKVDLSKVSFIPVNKGLRVGFVPLLRLINYFHKKPIGKKRFVFHVPGVVSIAKKLIKHVNILPLFGNYLNEWSLLGPGDIAYIKKYYQESNRNLMARVGTQNLEKFGYSL